MFGRLSDFNGSLFDDFRRLQREIDTLFGAWPQPAGIRAVASGTFPPINVGLTAEQIDVFVFVSGLDPAHLDVSIQHNLLTLSGRREIPRREGARYYRQERFSGKFSRVIALPEDADPDRVEARYRDGVLHVAVARRRGTAARRIDIN